MPNAFTEDQLVERSAISLFADLGWQAAPAMEKVLGLGGTRARAKTEVVLAPHLRAALERLNPLLPPDAISSAVYELARDRSAMSLAAANRQVWKAQPAAYF